eukprot:gene4054-480_t
MAVSDRQGKTGALQKPAQIRQIGEGMDMRAHAGQQFSLRRNQRMAQAFQGTGQVVNMVQAPKCDHQIKARLGEGQAFFVAHQTAPIIGHEIGAQISMEQPVDMAFFGLLGAHGLDNAAAAAQT